jgi:hypothetical protein
MGDSIPIIGICVKPRDKKYFAFPEGQIRTTSHVSRPTQRGVGHRHNEGRGAVDAEAATDETRLKRTAKACGPDVAVLASMHPEATVSRGATEAKQPFSGESTL